MQRKYADLSRRYSELQLVNANLSSLVNVLRAEVEHMNEKSELFDTIVEQCNYMAEQTMYRFNHHNAFKAGGARKGRRFA